MNNEKIINNGAVVEADKTKHSTVRSLVGKIARLPYAVREEVNRRLRNGERASTILPWLNGLPPVKKILGAQFAGIPISYRNLTEWRRAGYKRWLEKQEFVAELKALAEDTTDISRAAGQRLARGTASIAAAKILKMLHAISPEDCTPDELIKIAFATTALVQAEQNNERLKYEQTRVFQGNERLVLSWDKHLRGCVATAQRVLDDEIAKTIQEADIDNSEKIELLGHHLFGHKWQGRPVESPDAGGPKAEGKELERMEAERRASEEGRPEGGEPGAAPVSEQTPEDTAGRRGAAAAADPQVSPETAGEEDTDEASGIPTAASSSTVAKALAGQAPRPSPPMGAREKHQPPARELSPYDKALLEGKTHLEAMYAQVSPAGKPKENEPLYPKPSPLDAFSEPVNAPPRNQPQPHPYELRPAPGFNSLG